MHTRCIVETSGFTRGVCKNRGFYSISSFSWGIPREPATLRKAKTPRESPEKWTFLSLAFYNAPSLHTVTSTSRIVEFPKFNFRIVAWCLGGCLRQVKHRVASSLGVMHESKTCCCDCSPSQYCAMRNCSSNKQVAIGDPLDVMNPASFSAMAHPDKDIIL